MTLFETFAPQTNQDFPPKQVFFILDGVPRSMDVKDIPTYESVYKGVEDTQIYSHIKHGNVTLPQLEKK